jgi:3-isopropylmalate/(R)-2-methylmalate dehydratase large subunit
MPGTMIEEIFKRHSSDEVKTGNIIWMDIDVRSARDFGGANVVKNFEKWYPNDNVADPKKTFFTFDCVAPAKNIPYANNQQICRKFARKHGIKVFDCDRGIGSHVDIEEGIALPSFTVVGTDSHLNILGSIGAFGQGMGDRDIAFVFKTGKTWFEVPETMKIKLEGELEPNVAAKDLTLYIVGKIGSKGALGMAIEFYGKVIDDLSLAGRITLASMATETGAITALISPNEEVLNYCRERSGKNFEPIYAGDEAVYREEREIDVSGIDPQVAKPPRPDNVVPVKELSHVKIDSAFIGSCTNGTYEDISKVAKLVKGNRVAKGVLSVVNPATREVYGRLMKEGKIEDLFDAGFIIMNPGCGGCASGQVGMTGKGEVQISTANRNFPGKQGEGDVYLASPETVAASAILGRIASMDELGG